MILQAENTGEMLGDFNSRILELLSSWGISGSGLVLAHLGLMIVAISIIIFVITPIVRVMINKVLSKWAEKSSTQFDDLLVKNKFAWYLTQLIPFIIVSLSIPIIFFNFPDWITFATKLVDIYAVFLTLWIIRSLLSTLVDYGRTLESLRDKPLESYLQVVMIVLY